MGIEIENGKLASPAVTAPGRIAVEGSGSSCAPPPKPTIWNQRNGYLLITWPDGRTARIRALRSKRGRRKETLVEIHVAEAKVEREK